MHPYTQRNTGSLWGDGHELDGWREIAAVRNWDQLSSDEFIRIFPRLLDRSGAPPACLLDRLVACVAVLRRRSGAGRPPEAHSRAPGWASLQLSFWEMLTPADRVSYWIGSKEETDALVLIDALLLELGRKSLRLYEFDASADVAFWAGVHPAYFWPEAMLSHELFTALGWLGHAVREQRALMPRDIAEYFCDVIEKDGAGPPAVLDSRLDRFIRNPRVAETILSSARQRLDGHAAIFQMPRHDE